jgi:D-tyrosyl-tRNA(Tyr) deacylase
MIALLQRVTRAEVEVAGRSVARIGPGLAVLIGITRGDGPTEATRLLERLLALRVFADADGRMNRSLREVQGGLLLVPQFTLAADTDRGSRPGFSRAAPPAEARPLYFELLEAARAAHREVASGEFGAHMQLSLQADGPVTLWLEVTPTDPGRTMV